jgi:trimethylamine--corrinoid protein Co-methyltransferase
MWKNRLKPYDLLSGEEVEAVHGQAMNILEEIGVDFLHDRAREIFSKAGMPVEGNRVRLERAMVMELVAKTPPTFELQSRNPSRSVVLGGDNVVTAPVYGPPFITDLERGRRKTRATPSRWRRSSLAAARASRRRQVF